MNFVLFPDCEAKWIVGVQKPETQMQSHLMFSTDPSCSLSSEIFAISADFTFIYPGAATTTYENLIFIPKFFASSIISDWGSFLVSKIVGSTPFFLNSIAVSYPLSLLVKIKGFLPTNTP